MADRTAPVPDALTLAPPALPPDAGRLFLISAPLRAYQLWHAGESLVQGWDEPAEDRPVPGQDLVVDVCRTPAGRLVAGWSTEARYEKATWIDSSWEPTPPIPLSGVLADAGLRPQRRLPALLHDEAALRFLMALRARWLDPLSDRDGRPVGGTSRARSALLREAKLLVSGNVCEGCDVDYGQYQAGVGLAALDVHHLEPLGQRGEGATSLTELVVVCASCHRMLHGGRDKNPLELGALRLALGVPPLPPQL